MQQNGFWNKINIIIVRCLKYINNKINKLLNIKYYNSIQNNLHKTIDKLKKRYNNGKKLKVAFLYMYATSCQNISIFDKMLSPESIFDPYFIVNPDIFRSKENTIINGQKMN